MISVNASLQNSPRYWRCRRARGDPKGLRINRAPYAALGTTPIAPPMAADQAALAPLTPSTISEATAVTRTCMPISLPMAACTDFDLPKDPIEASAKHLRYEAKAPRP